MRIEKMNSSLQQRDFDYYIQTEYNDEYKEEKKKKKSLREMFEEEENNNKQQENQRVV